MKNIQKLSFGFTLIELVIVLAIAGVVVALAAPSFNSLMSSNRLNTSANNLVSALQLARSEAVKRSTMVVVKVVPTNATNNNAWAWANGWVVFADINQNGLQATDGTEPTIASFEALNGFSSAFNSSRRVFFINATGFPAAVFPDRVTYRPDGRSMVNGTFALCSPAATTNFRNVVIADTGRVHVDTPQTAGVGSYATNCP